MPAKLARKSEVTTGDAATLAAAGAAADVKVAAHNEAADPHPDKFAASGLGDAASLAVLATKADLEDGEVPLAQVPLLPTEKISAGAVTIVKLGADVKAAINGNFDPNKFIGNITALAQSLIDPAGVGNEGASYVSTVAGELSGTNSDGEVVEVGGMIISNGTAWVVRAAPPTDFSRTRNSVVIDGVTVPVAVAFTTADGEKCLACFTTDGRFLTALRAIPFASVDATREITGDDLRVFVGPLGNRPVPVAFGLGDGTHLSAFISRRGEFVAPSLERRLRAGVFEQPWRSQYADYVGLSTHPASPGIVRAPDGQLVATHDWYPGAVSTLVRRSTDEGRSWAAAVNVANMYWATPFTYSGGLGLLGTKNGYGGIRFALSADSGATFGASVELIAYSGEGLNGTQPGYHCAPTPVVQVGGYVFKCFERRSSADPRMEQGVLRGDPAGSGGLENPANWQLSNFVAWDAGWETGAVWTTRPGYSLYNGTTLTNLEGNLIVKRDGTLCVISRITNGPFDCAVLYDFDPDTMTLVFNQIINLPGGHAKFHVEYDATTDRYWSVGNPSGMPSRADVQVNYARNQLMLSVSADLLTWHTVAEIASDRVQWQPSQFTDSQAATGFQYPHCYADRDLYVAVRTAYLGSSGAHEANRATLHVVRDFRALLADY